MRDRRAHSVAHRFDEEGAQRLGRCRQPVAALVRAKRHRAQDGKRRLRDHAQAGRQTLGGARDDAWAARARAWADGGTPDGFEPIAGAARKTPRDVFLYFISGHKAANPAAAMAVIDRLG